MRIARARETDGQKKRRKQSSSKARNGRKKKGRVGSRKSGTGGKKREKVGARKSGTGQKNGTGADDLRQGRQGQAALRRPGDKNRKRPKRFPLPKDGSGNLKVFIDCPEGRKIRDYDQSSYGSLSSLGAGSAFFSGAGAASFSAADFRA